MQKVQNTGAAESITNVNTQDELVCTLGYRPDAVTLLLLLLLLLLYEHNRLVVMPEACGRREAVAGAASSRYIYCLLGRFYAACPTLLFSAYYC